MNIFLNYLFNFVIIISPIICYYPQIKKVINNKTDLGFNTERLSLTYCSVFTEIMLNFSSNSYHNFNYKNNLSLSQGRLGIYLAVRAIIKPNQNEIILSPYTIFDVVNMVICAGGKPVFAEIDFPSISLCF